MQTDKQTLCTLWDIGWKIVQKVCECTLCADFICRLSADLKWFSEKVCIKSASAHLLQTFAHIIVETLCILLSFFHAGFRQILFWSNVNVIHINLVPFIKALGKDLDKKCMHTLCKLFFWLYAHHVPTFFGTFFRHWRFHLFHQVVQAPSEFLLV